MEEDEGRSPTLSEAAESSQPSANNTSPAHKRKKKVSATVPRPFNLSLHSRGEERSKFDAGQRHKLEEQEKLCRERREREEEESRKELRKKQGFKANPVRVFKSVSIQPSDRPLTQPEPPLLLTAILPEIKNEKRKQTVADTAVGERGRVREVRRRKRRRDGNISCSGSDSSRDGSLMSREFSIAGCEPDGPQSLENDRDTLNYGPEEGEEEKEGRGMQKPLLQSRMMSRQSLLMYCDLTAIVTYYLSIYYVLYLMCS